MQKIVAPLQMPIYWNIQFNKIVYFVWWHLIYPQIVTGTYCPYLLSKEVKTGKTTKKREVSGTFLFLLPGVSYLFFACPFDC